ncbi:hypothetical protein HDU76_014056 [Blyttiomyces sp. JEL0837]|nr:hypothetical protein HDU76_014056 [Blyttiomyces sp. JEL0837]
MDLSQGGQNGDHSPTRQTKIRLRSSFPGPEETVEVDRYTFSKASVMALCDFGEHERRIDCRRIFRMPNDRSYWMVTKAPFRTTEFQPSASNEAIIEAIKHNWESSHAIGPQFFSGSIKRESSSASSSSSCQSQALLTPPLTPPEQSPTTFTNKRSPRIAPPPLPLNINTKPAEIPSFKPNPTRHTQQLLYNIFIDKRKTNEHTVKLSGFFISYMTVNDCFCYGAIVETIGWCVLGPGPRKGLQMLREHPGMWGNDGKVDVKPVIRRADDDEEDVMVKAERGNVKREGGVKLEMETVDVDERLSGNQKGEGFIKGMKGGSLEGDGGYEIVWVDVEAKGKDKKKRGVNTGSDAIKGEEMATPEMMEPIRWRLLDLADALCLFKDAVRTKIYVGRERVDTGGGEIDVDENVDCEGYEDDGDGDVAIPKWESDDEEGGEVMEDILHDVKEEEVGLVRGVKVEDDHEAEDDRLIKRVKVEDGERNHLAKIAVKREKGWPTVIDRRNSGPVKLEEEGGDGIKRVKCENVDVNIDGGVGSFEDFVEPVIMIDDLPDEEGKEGKGRGGGGLLAKRFKTEAENWMGGDSGRIGGMAEKTEYFVEPVMVIDDLSDNEENKGKKGKRSRSSSLKATRGTANARGKGKRRALTGEKEEGGDVIDLTDY